MCGCLLYVFVLNCSLKIQSKIWSYSQATIIMTPAQEEKLIITHIVSSHISSIWQPQYRSSFPMSWGLKVTHSEWNHCKHSSHSASTVDVPLLRSAPLWNHWQNIPAAHSSIDLHSVLKTWKRNNESHPKNDSHKNELIPLVTCGKRKMSWMWRFKTKERKNSQFLFLTDICIFKSHHLYTKRNKPVLLNKLKNRLHTFRSHLY